MSIIAILVVLIIVGVVLWGVGQLPLDPMIKTIIRVVAVIFVLLWLLQAFGLLSGSSLRV